MKRLVSGSFDDTVLGILMVAELSYYRFRLTGIKCCICSLFVDTNTLVR